MSDICGGHSHVFLVSSFLFQWSYLLRLALHRPWLFREKHPCFQVHLQFILVWENDFCTQNCFLTKGCRLKYLNLKKNQGKGCSIGEKQMFSGWWYYSVWYCNSGFVTLWICLSIHNFVAQEVNLHICKFKKNYKTGDLRMECGIWQNHLTML